MKTTQTKSLILKSFLLSISLSLAVLFLLLSLPPKSPSSSSSSTTTITTTTTPVTQHSDLRIRPGYSSYDLYIKKQLDKTLNPKLREIWTTRDWKRKVEVFGKFFDELRVKKLLFYDSKALCIGARVGQEVAALKGIGVNDSVGIDLVPYPPLVIKGDFHKQPFDNESFDFEFSNVFDHALYPDKFIGEIERTLKPGGICVLHVAISRRSDKYSANDLFSIGPLKEMFKDSEIVHVRKVDGFGLDTEVVFRKKKKKKQSSS
ncbi:S-adenosyl-l-methionine-dependent methyltransferases superfamily protein [Thalictrum thalictroides]|uniref:S-adenosyl-l-methionine-dependent methyltransferases superfamily protein n=1 Tax=Thalictrum thalictroides TaxID=46969 RepID=A0A7J6W0C8_THATH|nr:S-adenosyl-l-methionine-dependent methyltransferases superfamily protein [Thalictrum thalictroides]